MDAPGPIEVVNLAALDLVVRLPPKMPDELEGQADYDRDLAELTTDLWRLSVDAMEEWGPELQALGGEVVEGLAGDDSGVGEGEFGDPEAAAAETDDLMVTAHQEIPAEAWQPLPAPYRAPADYSNYYEEGQPGLPPPQPPPPPPPSQGVTITNMDRPGMTDYWVGDRWRVDALGPAWQPVTIHAWQDSVDRGTAQLGISDGQGRFVLFGAMGPGHTGYWVEEWRMGDQLLNPILTFTVF